MGIPLSHVLTDFGPAKSPKAAVQRGRPMSVVPDVDPADDLARRIDVAYARGADEARLAADAEQEQRLAEALAQAQQERLAERARWTREQGEELAARLTSAVEALETRIAEAVGRILTPFLEDELRRASVERLAESVRTLLSGGGQPALRVSGPDDLLSALRERLGDCPAAVEWEPNGALEVTVASSDSVIETEIQRWIDVFAGARP